MDETKQVRVRIPVELVADLQRLADQRDESDLSKEIRRALRLYVARADKEGAIK